MNLRVWALLLFAVLPGAVFAGMSAYWLFPDWAQLEVSQKRYAELAGQPNPSAPDLMIAEAAENRHRINCFAEGVGVLLGSTILAIGIHGLCVLPDRSH
ncbi:hypothetical protein [Leptolyngbya ohadii]|uniref:hypothetical protein n=1 Tax=Leptolyngbya ohadii TaxID=1962290 RepID=UPI0015C6266F|nr:hypothetical protein [Leptolyngbya ohadii]